MKNGRPVRQPFQFDLAVEAGLEDRLDTLIGARVSIAGPKGCGLQSIRTIGFSQTQDSQTRAEALFGMRAGLKNLFHQTCGGWPDTRRPMDESFWRPFQVALMRLGPMGIQRRVGSCFVAARMRGHTLALVEDLDSHHGKAYVELTMQQSIGNAVIMPVDLDVIVDIDACLLPF